MGGGITDLKKKPGVMFFYLFVNMCALGWELKHRTRPLEIFPPSLFVVGLWCGVLPIIFKKR